MRTVFAMWAVLAVAVSARGEVFSSEFNAPPTEEGWELVGQPCGVTGAIENGHYVQQLDHEGCSNAAQEVFARTTGNFYGSAGQFLEFRVQTNGGLSGSCIGTPTRVRLTPFMPQFGYFFHIIVANRWVDFFDVSVAPPMPFSLASGGTHTIRLEWKWALGMAGSSYRFFVDDVWLWAGGAEGWFLSDSTLLEWSGTSCHSTIENRWDYIRYGDIPEDGSGDFDTSGQVDGRDYYFFEDCFSRRDPAQDDGPSCRFADMDGDTDVDLADFAGFQVLFQAPG